MFTPEQIADHPFPDILIANNEAEAKVAAQDAAPRRTPTTPPDSDTPHSNTTDSYIPVPLAPRCNGWTAERQRVFLAALAETGSVVLASARAGMAKRSAYRLRARPDAAAFAGAWDAALRAARARDLARRPVAPGGAMPSRRQMYQAIRDLHPEAFARSTDASENRKRA